MDDSVYEKYIKSGKIAGEARDYGAGLIKENASLLDVADKVESRIVEKGAGLAFPVNISINDVAAHFSPRFDDAGLVFKRGDVVKLDVGAHVDGFIADTACTIEVGSEKHSDMIDASKNALAAAIDFVRDGAMFSELGGIIDGVISSSGFKTVDNLTGHSLEKFNLHSGVSVPNVKDRLNRYKAKSGDVFAIEPFATDGAGHVVGGQTSNIYIYISSFKSRLIRDPRARAMSMKIHKNFNKLPFAQRWCKDIIPNTDISLKKLMFAGCIRQYPQLIDMKNGIVTQAEHTVIVKDDGCEVTT